MIAAALSLKRCEVGNNVLTGPFFFIVLGDRYLSLPFEAFKQVTKQMQKFMFDINWLNRRIETEQWSVW